MDEHQSSASSKLFAWLESMPSIYDMKFEIETAQAVYDWCLRGLGYKVGDKVEFVYNVGHTNPGGGWYPYREALARGQSATVKRFHFNKYSKNGEGAWHAEVVLDREWTLSDYPVGTITRHWHGPVADTPEGYIPPTPYDQKLYPEGHKHTFSVLVEEIKPCIELKSPEVK